MATALAAFLASSIAVLPAVGVAAPDRMLASVEEGIRGGTVTRSAATAVERGGPVDLLVTYRYQEVLRDAERFSRGEIPASALAARAFAEQKASVLQSAPGVHLARDFPALPVSLLTVSSSNQLMNLADSPQVTRVALDGRSRILGGPNLDLIDQPEAALLGYDGAGAAVAVLDTGIDYTRPAFGSCVTPGDGCRVAFSRDFAPDDGSRDDNGHGTNVGGIVSAVAPGAEILALDVFDGTGAWHSDEIAAIDWVVQHQAEYGIRAMNLSLGDYSHETSECVDSWAAAPFATARAAGVLPVVASGNDAMGHGYYEDGISDPACAPGAVAVGAVHDSDIGKFSSLGCHVTRTGPDLTTCFSQAGTLLDLLAPGVRVKAAGSTFTGTSQAAPHVAALVSLMAGEVPSADPDEIEGVMGTTGPVIIEPMSGSLTHRIDVRQAVTALVARHGSGLSLSVDDVTIAEGDFGSTSALFSLMMSQTSSTPVTVSYRTMRGTARSSDADFVATEDVVVVSPGQSFVDVVIPINGDTKVEDDEVFYLDLVAASGATISDPQGAGVIADDDAGDVPLKVSGRLKGAYGEDGKYQLFHAGLSSTIAYVGSVFPNHAGRVFRWILYGRSSGGWVPVGTSDTGLDPSSRGSVRLNLVVRGRYALEGQFLGDDDHGPASSQWDYFRVTG